MLPSIPHHYDLRLVALSIIIAMGAADAAINMAGRTAAAESRSRFAWLGGGAVAMGIGIWSMHYIGMLAYVLPFPVLYDLPTVLASLAAAILASAVALYCVSRHDLAPGSVVVASVIMGGGIASMHYIGWRPCALPPCATTTPQSLPRRSLLPSLSLRLRWCSLFVTGRHLSLIRRSFRARW
jgi:NO-binding membrane sensor protein with MHYT domain